MTDSEWTHISVQRQSNTTILHTQEYLEGNLFFVKTILRDNKIVSKTYTSVDSCYAKAKESNVIDERSEFEEWARQYLPDALLVWSDINKCYMGIESNAAWTAWKYLTKTKVENSNSLSEKAEL